MNHFYHLMNFYNSIYKISLVKESFSQLLEYFKILYTFSRKIQLNCLNLKNCRKKILNFVEYFEKEFPINDFDFYLLHCSKINFFKIIYVNNCSCIIKEIFYIHFLNNETSSFKKCFMFDLFYFFFNLSLAVWLQNFLPSPLQIREHIWKLTKKIKFSNLIFSKIKLQMKKISKFNFRIISLSFSQNHPPFFSLFVDHTR